jgi:hypothetical protein
MRKLSPCLIVVLRLRFFAAREEEQILRAVYPERSERAQDDVSF